jgi:hypothetical protein
MIRLCMSRPYLSFFMEEENERRMTDVDIDVIDDGMDDVIVGTGCIVDVNPDVDVVMFILALALVQTFPTPTEDKVFPDDADVDK